MKFSNNYIFYPGNKDLEQAIEHYKSLDVDDVDESDAPDNNVTVADNFSYSRGNYEQRRYSSNVLEKARLKLQASITDVLREADPLEWARTQNSYGNILAALAQQQQDVAFYEQSIQAFKHALEVLNQQTSPEDWASTQCNLGTVYQALGKQLQDTKLLKASVDAYTEALLEITRKNQLFKWALTMYQLGATFHAYGKLLKGNRTFQKSVVAYKNALVGFDADETALELAATHNSRGAVLHHLGEAEGNTGRLEEAFRSYDTALTVCMEQQLPIHLAVMCRVNRATVRGVLAELSKDSSIAEETVDDFEVIIELFNNSCQPLCLTHCEEQLAKAQALL